MTAFGKIGLVPEVGTSSLLTRRLGYQRAYGLFVRGRPLSGAEAMEAGLANEIVDHDALLPALERCERVMRLTDHVPVLTKTILRHAADLSWEQAIAIEGVRRADVLHHRRAPGRRGRVALSGALFASTLRRAARERGVFA